jgi:hypothetical protein
VERRLWREDAEAERSKVESGFGGRNVLVKGSLKGPLKGPL